MSGFIAYKLVLFLLLVNLYVGKIYMHIKYMHVSRGREWSNFFKAYLKLSFSSRLLALSPLPVLNAKGEYKTRRRVNVIFFMLVAVFLLFVLPPYSR
jgi:hypothetical protein